ncbi:MAG: 50S ribosomal protein L15 [Coriobacteriaceae bacterium]|nr:50S ribosomal protein L15 [Coriobacteriaceae bacterium]
MQLHDLTPVPGSNKPRKRVGRGNSSGTGTYSGRGQNGQGSRSGGTKGAGFEGGQTPLAMRLPKLPGFVSPRRIEYTPINVATLEERFENDAVVDGAALKAARLVKSEFEPVKVLGNGEITKKLTVKVDKVSASAQAKIEAAGGKVELSC